ncbi:uncharacterized protein BP01DRAFT_72981 [Aspergillus saccharolyticus JOP 1030-1]|uniref:Methyltransferase type 11 domain-containing protein n=1 Tax=Aspergillus saccharolyticus JOP 1030-1 TaxID=1450539 RepID=A0A318ZNR6_9EURO|nr:hypothetical protein BP01DRAFT_72981 [Aspergillus saccharolyticus JOP 1030-1]PYH49186.1 hypothetical protein BP01DRAFT_72981 [Aspergillus saccharolyticus JOP 1030-1]
MESHKSDGGRIPRLKDVASQSRNVSSTGMASVRSSNTAAQLLHCPRIPRPNNASYMSSRTSLLSDAADSRYASTSSNKSRIPTGLVARPPMTSQDTIHQSSLHFTPGMMTDRHVSLASHMAAEPPRPAGSEPQTPGQGRLRNVLRRKAPTIGQHSAQIKPMPDRIRSQKLNVLIPEHPSIGPSANTPSQIPPSSNSLIGQVLAPMTSQQNPLSSVSDTGGNVPKELASLRATTINTQNLPPPTPVIPSASSPSTRYSESPGMWSRTSTPTTLSSYSPGIPIPPKGPRIRQPSPSQSRLPIFSPQLYQLSSSAGKIAQSAIDGARLKSTQDNSLPEAELSGEPNKASAPNVAYGSLPRKSSTWTKSTISNGHKSSHNLQAVYEPTQNFKPASNRERADKMKISVQIPTRPSREGTHQLVLEPSPVIRSNIVPAALTGHRRRISADRHDGLTPSALSATTSVDCLHSTVSARTTSRVAASEIPRSTPQFLGKGPKPQHEAGSPSKSLSLGLFAKKSKSETEKEIEGRTVRKGPAAGTGHEGYGRYSQRGRKMSTASSTTSRARSSSSVRSGSKSVTSNKSNTTRGRADFELDDFLMQRLEPVVIHGGGMDGAAALKRQSEQSTSNFSTGTDSILIQQFKVSPSTSSSTETLPSSRATSVTLGEPIWSGTEGLTSSSTLAFSEPASIPVTRTEPSKSIKAQTFAQSHPQGHAPHVANDNVGQLRAPEVQSPRKKASKKGLGMKWNIFQRKPDTVRSDHDIGASSGPKLHATVSPITARRPIPYYALLDVDPDPLEEIVHDVENSPPTEDEEIVSCVEAPAALKMRDPTESILLPSPPSLHDSLFQNQAQSSKVYFNKGPSPRNHEERFEEKSEGRHTSRLTSIGRIPRVVSRRERPHKPALQSFSRPFSVADSPSLLAPAAPKPNEFCSQNSQPFIMQKLESPHHESARGFDLTNPFRDLFQFSVLDFIAGPYAKDEFMTFSPRKVSVVSSSSGSESLAAITAVVPSPRADLTEDEVWGEYDDLIDHVLSPQTTSTLFSLGSETERNLENVTTASRTLQAELTHDQANAFSGLIDGPKVELTPSSPISSNGSIRLRRSTVAAETRASIAPSSQPSFSSIIACYCDTREDKRETTEQEFDNLTMLPQTEQSLGLHSSETLVASPSLRESRQRSTALFDIAERNREGPTALTNIRSGSLMTSRWLSFGRVLFSPGHSRIKSGDQDRILVVDGLGNDDWSFYCALTYPTASIHSLNEGVNTATFKHPAAWKPPANHHAFYQSTLGDTLPFPKGYFTVAVLRFPAACAESAQARLVSECKRVLRAGGYLEMSILDRDMVNMGNRTRRALRTLKERTFASDPSISLKPASDSVQKLLGQCGFDNLRRCMVRIPVAGMIVRTSASSTSTASSDPSMLAATSSLSSNISPSTVSSATVYQRPHGEPSPNDVDLSLGDLLSDPSPSPSNDESIRKIVAKVGRWWYTRCYEIPVLPNGDVALSIWSDRKVIRECQQRGTGFRLWVAYAQKPCEKRRTMSV